MFASPRARCHGDAVRCRSRVDVATVACLAVIVAASARGETLQADTPTARDGILHIGAPHGPINAPIDLGGTWRIRFDDDGRFADPGFDDAGWEVAQVPLGIGRQGPVGGQNGGGALRNASFVGVFWYRLRITLAPPPSGEALALRIGQCDSASEVFVDGVKVGGVGRIPTGGDVGVSRHDQAALYTVPAGAADDGELVLAVRVWRSETRAASNPPRGGITHRPLQLGEAKALARATVTDELSVLVLVGVFAIVGLYHLQMWSRRRDQVNYVWFGLFSLLIAGYLFIRACLQTSQARIPAIVTTAR